MLAAISFAVAVAFCLISRAPVVIAGESASPPIPWRELPRHLSAPMLAASLAGVCVCVTSEVLVVTFGLWLSRVQGWGVAEVAQATFAMGVSDVAAELIVISCVTWRRVCPFRFSRGWLWAYVVTLVPLPVFCAGGALPGVFGFTLALLAFETAIVGTLGAAVTMESTALAVSCFGASAALGQVIGDLIALRLFELAGEGIFVPAAFCFLLMIACSAVAQRFLRPNS
jgi:hypothetical protein